jgi:hypothetical protein
MRREFWESDFGLCRDRSRPVPVTNDRLEFDMVRERKSFRLKGYNYSSDNLYFVTTCVNDRLCCFGEITGTGRDLSLHGDAIAYYYIHYTPAILW